MGIGTINICCDKCKSSSSNNNKILFIESCEHRFFSTEEIAGYKILPASYYKYSVAISDEYILPNKNNKILEYEEFDDEDKLRMIRYDYIETPSDYELGCDYYSFDYIAIGDIIICDFDNFNTDDRVQYFNKTVYPYLLTRIPKGCTLINVQTSENTIEFSLHFRMLEVV